MNFYEKINQKYNDKYFYRVCRKSVIRIRGSVNDFAFGENPTRSIKIGYTQKEASKKLGITQAYLSQIEKGKREPSIRLLQEMRRLYKTSFDRLLSGFIIHLDNMDVREAQFEILSRAITIIEHRHPFLDNKEASNSMRYLEKEINIIREEIKLQKKESKTINNYY